MAAKSKIDHCDNHPDKEAVIVTDGEKRHSVVKLCEKCVPKNWRAKED